MTNSTKPNFRFQNWTRAEFLQDAVLISSFGIWAAVIGLSPVLAYHLLFAA
jgi:hypothetical protein